MKRHIIKATLPFTNLFLRSLKPHAAPVPIHHLTFHMTTPNGYCIESMPGMGLVSDGALSHTFVIYSPAGAIRWCAVALTAEAIEEIEAYCAGDCRYERSRFLLAVCEEALVSFLTQNNRLPPDGLLQVAKLTCPLKAWIDVVLCRQPASL